MTLKASVHPQGIRPELVLALCIADSACRGLHVDLTVLALTHGGDAAELQVSYIAPERRLAVRNAIALAVGSDYDVTLEPTYLALAYNPKEQY